MPTFLTLFPKFLLAALLALSVVPRVNAEEKSISVREESGETRAMTEVEKTGNITVDVEDDSGEKATGVIVTLTSSGGEVLSTTVVNGIAVFEGVGPGVWTIASATSGITFTNIAISTAAIAATGGAFGTAGAITILGATGGLAGAAIITNDSEDPPLSPLQ